MYSPMCLTLARTANDGWVVHTFSDRDGKDRVEFAYGSQSELMNALAELTRPTGEPSPSFDDIKVRDGEYDAMSIATLSCHERDWEKWEGDRYGKLPPGIMPDTYVQYETHSKGAGECRACEASWRHNQSGWDIVRYRKVEK